MKRNCTYRSLAARAAALTVTALSVFPASAQFDPAIFAKWGSVEVLKYSVVATYGSSDQMVVSGDTLTVKDGNWTYVYTLEKG